MICAAAAQQLGQLTTVALLINKDKREQEEKEHKTWHY
jgi:hypothetical protein